jgi:hypothetical protein
LYLSIRASLDGANARADLSEAMQHAADLPDLAMLDALEAYQIESTPTNRMALLDTSALHCWICG